MQNQDILYCADNLKVMQELPSESVDLIATDPPFNTGRDWGAFNDKWEGGLKGYLTFMEPRLQECHRLLKDTGSLYLHCDQKASHYLKVMLDGIFGIKQFRNEIVWRRTTGQSNQTKLYATVHDTILFYTKSNDFNFNQQFEPLSEAAIKRYNKIDEDGRRYMFHIGGKRYKRKKRYYLDECRGKRLNTLWTNILMSSIDPQRVGYPPQKPIALLARIIKASSNPGDIVLDPFAGSGTTLEAAQALGRHWIGIDQNPEAIDIIEQRLKDGYGMLLEYERL